MIERTEEAPDTRAPSVRPHVWVCTYDHRNGIDVWACESEEIAFGELAAVCREFWEEAREVDGSFVPREEDVPFPTDPPADDRAAVELFFTVMNDADPPETFVIAAHEVIGVKRGVRR
jgi:hypothetical protein